jgi:hypothetical protein
MAKKSLKSKFTAAALAQRTKESFDTKDAKGNFSSYFDKELNGDMWKPGAGDHIIDVVPYLAGKNHPQAQEGDPVYVLETWVHRTDSGLLLCPQQTFGKKCPVCEWVKKQNQMDSSEENFKRLSPHRAKRRVAYNIVCYDTDKEEDKGIQIWEASHFLTEDKICAIARNKRTGSFIPFSSPENGKNLSFTKTGSGMNTKLEGWALEDREIELDEQLLEETFCLEDYLVELSYEDLVFKWYGSLGYTNDEIEDFLDGLLHIDEDRPEEPVQEEPPEEEGTERRRGGRSRRKTTEESPEETPEPEEPEEPTSGRRRGRGRGRTTEPEEPTSSRRRGRGRTTEEPEINEEDERALREAEEGSGEEPEPEQRTSRTRRRTSSRRGSAEPEETQEAEEPEEPTSSRRRGRGRTTEEPEEPTSGRRRGRGRGRTTEPEEPEEQAAEEGRTSRRRRRR